MRTPCTPLPTGMSSIRISRIICNVGGTTLRLEGLGGGGCTPLTLQWLYRYVQHQKVRVFEPFWSEIG